MMNIGVRPTVSNTHQRSIEVYIFDFDETIYDQHLRIEFIDRLRDEKNLTGSMN
ncbi:hypothetical protein EMGBS15_17970 [Filimonas sp.]|nr:hypothetical protein EMGBS15_17970 [Filimonas sp.]